MKPDNETLRQQLQIEWHDHIQTRSQTWRTLQIEAALVIGFVGADIRFNNIYITISLAVLVIISTLSGIGISIHHRQGQAQIFARISKLEKALGLGDPALDLHEEVKPPRKFRWLDIMNPTKMYTPLFIIRMQISLVLFTVIYAAGRLLL